MIEIKDATLTAAGHTVFAGVSLTARDGRLTAVCGRAGSGKTLLLKGMAGLLPFDEGYVTIDGELLEPATANFFRSRMAYVPQCLDVPGRMTVDELFGIFAAIHAAADRKVLRSRMADLWTPLLLDGELWGMAFSGLSASVARRVLLSLALAAPCSIVIADEPTEGLAADEAEAVTSLLREAAAGGCAVLVATTDAAVEALADAKLVLQAC